MLNCLLPIEENSILFHFTLSALTYKHVKIVFCFCYCHLEKNRVVLFFYLVTVKKSNIVRMRMLQKIKCPR